MKKILVLALGAAALGARAEVAYLNGSDSIGYSSMTNAAKWNVGSMAGAALGAAGEALPADYDYIVNNGRQLRTPFDSFVFPGNSLKFENGAFYSLATTTDREYTFKNMILQAGEMLNLQTHSFIIKGKVSVIAPSTSPFGLCDCSSSRNSNGKGVTIDADVEGDENAALWIFTHWNYVDGWNSDKYGNSTFRFPAGRLAGFKGTIGLHQFCYANRNLYRTNDTHRAELKSGTVTTDARVTVYRHCGVGGLAGGDVFALKELNFTDKSSLDVAFDVDNKTASLVTVTDTLTLSGQTLIRIIPNKTVPTSLADVPDLEILKAPQGVTLKADDFKIVTSYPVFDLAVKEDADGLSTLCLKWGGNVVTQTAADAYTDDKAARDLYTFVSGAHWSDGNPAAATNVYYSSTEMRNTSGSKGNITAPFGGYALVKDGGQLDVFDTMTINDLRTKGSTVNVSAYSTVSTLAGHIYHRQSAITGSCKLYLTAINNRTTIVAAEIEGNALISVESQVKSRGTVRLAGCNTNFLGQVQVMNNGSSSLEYRPTLEFTCPEALGGPLEDVHYDYHLVQGYAQLWPVNSMTLDRENCGFLVNGPCSVHCTNGIEFILKEHTTWKGEMTKTGVGTFGLAGDAPNFGTAVGTTPTAGKNRLTVAEGKLKIASSEAFQGTEVVMSEGTELVVCVPTDATQGVGKYGLHNTKWDNALVLPEGGVSVNIVDPNGDAEPSRAIVRPIVVPICTVNATAADAIRGKLHLAACPYATYSMKDEVVETTNADGSVTFAAKLDKGLMILVR